MPFRSGGKPVKFAMAPSETSPLLPNNGTVSTGAIPTRDAESNSGHGRTCQDEQAKESSSDAQKQLKYIVPAISIGVCTFIPHEIVPLDFMVIACQDI